MTWKLTRPETNADRWVIVQVLHVRVSDDIYETIDAAGEAAEMLMKLNPGAVYNIAHVAMPTDQLPERHT